MSNIKLAQKGKAEKSLNIQIRYSEGVMTKKEWVELQFKKSSRVEQSTKNRIKFDRRKFNRICNYKEQEEYETKCNEIVVCYKLYEVGETAFYEITKTEYDYFNALN